MRTMERHCSSSRRNCQPFQPASGSAQLVQRPVRTHRSSSRRALICRAGDDQALARFARLSQKAVLDEAARRYQEGIKQGIDEDQLVAMELGADSPQELSDLAKTYKDKIKAKLKQRADELQKEDEARRAKLAPTLDLGKEAYACGEYAAAVKLLEKAVEEVGPDSQLGGEAQLWLALAYQACGREQDCIDVYKSVETNHPNRKIQKQAADLRYIMEAPKLEIGKDERVTIPLLQTDTWRAKDRKTGYSSRLATPPKVKEKTYWDSATWDLAPVSFVPDKWYVRVAWIVLLVGTSIYGYLQMTDG